MKNITENKIEFIEILKKPIVKNQGKYKYWITNKYDLDLIIKKFKKEKYKYANERIVGTTTIKENLPNLPFGIYSDRKTKTIYYNEDKKIFNNLNLTGNYRDNSPYEGQMCIFCDGDTHDILSKICPECEEMMIEWEEDHNEVI